MKVVLLSTYELGRQPFGLASPAAWLRDRGHEVHCADLAAGVMPAAVRDADFIGFWLPMHTATRLAGALAPKVRALNPRARLCAYGLYAPLNSEYLKGLGFEIIIGGEFERALSDVVDRLAAGAALDRGVLIRLDRLKFRTPDRSGLPALSGYARLHRNGEQRIAGYTEATRGCKHLCRHCPVVPVYEGAFRVVQPDVVLEDIRRQVEAGAQHITFGDPDFFNGPTHAARIVEALHREFPRVTYDVTIKVEHLLRHRDLLPMLKNTGCVLVTSAVESLDDAVLEKLEKGHTRADFERVLAAMREAGLALNPTFIAFTPWTTRRGYVELLSALNELGLVDAVNPVQLALRLLITAGSRLLELEEIRAIAGEFDPAGLVYPWRHPDPDIDALASSAMKLVAAGQKAGLPLRVIFRRLCELAGGPALPDNFDLLPRAAIPYLDEPWYC
jgi:radical SAM superfamily enzyme YgiQ (UPF0313 family)